MDGSVAATASKWVADTNAAVCIRLFSGDTEGGVLRALSTGAEGEKGEKDEGEEDQEGDGADVIEFHPAFTYPIYGEHERVFGYKGLRIGLNYAAGSLATYLEIECAARVEQMESTAVALRADDVDGPLRRVLAGEAVCATREEFAQRVARDTDEFRPRGRKVHEYRERSGAGGSGEGLRYEVYESGFDCGEFRRYHARMQTLLLFFIEGAQFIDDGDERWRVFTVFERLDLGARASYSLVGFCTMYRFYHWPDQRRARISQFLVLPPFQGHGHGAALYAFIHTTVLASPEYADLSVEDPSEAFDDMRDRCDMRFLDAHGAFDALAAPVPRAAIRALQARFKLSARQTTRCVEMALLRRAPAGSAAFARLRLSVKRRIYAQNIDVLQGLDPDERKKRLADSFAAVIEDYRRILSLL